jgi:hypothetical protein
MKIISEGVWKQRMTCRGCSTIFEFNVPDIEFEQAMQEDESFDFSYFVKCPGCTRKIVLRSLPDRIQSEVTEDYVG